MNVVISSAGRRGALVRLWQEDLRALVRDGDVIAADASRLSAAARIADHAELVPGCTHPDFIDAMIELCVRRRAGLIVPTIDTELITFAANRDTFAAAGIVVSVSGGHAVEMAIDKIRFHAWLVANQLPTVATTTLEAALRDRVKWPLPLVVKPARGSSSIGVSVARTERDLEFRSSEFGLIAQQLALGSEYTADAWADQTGRCRCVVLRRRVEVRAGEVSKAVTVRWPALEALITRVVDSLPTAYGAVTVQLFVEDGQPETARIIEVNPRYGGGYPLTWQVGAHFPLWTLEELMGLRSTASSDRVRSGLVMPRFDDAVFVDAADVGL